MANWNAGFAMISSITSFESGRSINVPLNDEAGVVLKKPAIAWPQFRSAIQDTTGVMFILHHTTSWGVFVPAGTKVTMFREGQTDPGYTSFEGDSYPTEGEFESEWGIRC